MANNNGEDRICCNNSHNKTVFDSESVKISFERCILINGDRWLFANEFNALCTIKKNSSFIEFVASVPGEYLFSKYLFSDIKLYNDKIYLIPRGASALLIYDMNSKLFERVPIKEPDINPKNTYFNWLKFSTSLIVNDCLIMIPRTYPAICIFDIKSGSISYETEWISQIEKYIFEDEAYFWSDYCFCEDELILACSNCDCLIKRSLSTGRYSMIKIDNDNSGFTGISFTKEKLFLLGRKNGNVIVSENKGSLKYLSVPEEVKVSKIIGYSELVEIDDYLYAIPMWSNYLLQIDVNNNKITPIKNYDIERNGNEEIATCCGWVEGNNLCCYNNLNKSIEKFDGHEIVSSEKFLISENSCHEFTKLVAEYPGEFYETSVFSLKEFFNLISL